MTERLQEILNRKPSKWGNLTVKEFERDIKLLQERVQELEEFNRILSSDKSMFIEELVREQQQNQRYLEVIEKVRSYMETDAIMTFDQDERLEGIHEVLVDFYKEESE